MEIPADQARTPRRIAAGVLVFAALAVLAVLGYTGGSGIAIGAYYYYCPGGGAGSNYGYCPPPQPPPPAHFLRYDLSEPEQAGETVTLIDQFGTRQIQVQEPEWLMTPTEKQRTGRPAEPIQRPDEHLVCRGLEYVSAAERTVRVSNQFTGDSTLRVKRPLALCAPASKTLTGTPGAPPDDLNHFLCYDVTGETPLFPSETLTAVDQFGTRTVRIDRTRELCNPVEKRRQGRPPEPIIRPDEHLVCYRITTFSPSFSAQNVFARDQFGLDTLRVDDLRRLCVPSTKT